eukprot:scaffold5187_cov23-Tisochrysis_lutea.AAC.3
MTTNTSHAPIALPMPRHTPATVQADADRALPPWTPNVMKEMTTKECTHLLPYPDQPHPCHSADTCRLCSGSVTYIIKEDGNNRLHAPAAFARPPTPTTVQADADHVAMLALKHGCPCLHTEP